MLNRVDYYINNTWLDCLLYKMIGWWIIPGLVTTVFAYQPYKLIPGEAHRFRRQAGPGGGPNYMGGGYGKLPLHAGGGISAQWNQSAYGQPENYYNSGPAAQPAPMGRPLYYSNGTYSGYHHVVEQKPTHVADTLVAQPVHPPMHTVPQPSYPLLIPAMNQSYPSYSAPPFLYPPPLPLPQALPVPLLPPSYAYEGVGQPRVYGYGLQAPPIAPVAVGGGTVCQTLYGPVPCPYPYSLPDAAYPRKKKYRKKPQTLYDWEGNPVDNWESEDGSYGPLTTTTTAASTTSSSSAGSNDTTSASGAATDSTTHGSAVVVNAAKL